MHCECGHSFIKGQLGLSLVPIDDLKRHSALEHFGLEISGVLFPVGGFPNAKPGFLAKTDERIVGCESAADNRHDIYVAASRAREPTTLVVDAKGIRG
jgi:hypothetical protein